MEDVLNDTNHVPVTVVPVTVVPVTVVPVTVVPVTVVPVTVVPVTVVPVTVVPVVTPARLCFAGQRCEDKKALPASAPRCFFLGFDS